MLLGSDSQLLAFAAAAKGLAGRMFFAPLPEMFADLGRLRAAFRAIAADSYDGARPVHLRFGSVRAARVLKGARNACVVAEAAGVPPLTASHHPFASGMVLPDAIRRVFVYRAVKERPRRIGGAAIPASILPQSCVTADLPAGLPDRRGAGTAAEAGLELVSLAEFRSLAWANGPVRARGARVLAEAGQPPAVLLPWNMDHPGSIVPLLLERLARLHAPGHTGKSGHEAAPGVPRIVLLPFNYVGQTGIIRRLIARLREATPAPDTLLGQLFLARTGSLDAVALLRRIAGVAWVDGNDPEHWWTLARLRACGVATILIDPEAQPAHGQGARLPADEAVWVEAETRCGALIFPARLPSLRALPVLLTMTAARSARPPAARRARAFRPARAAEAPAAS